MPSLKYVGKYPDQESSVAHRLYVDDRQDAMGVDQAQVDQAISNALVPKVTKSYVDSQDNLYALKSYADTQDAKYANSSLIGAANGIATLDANGKVVAAQQPNLRDGASWWYVSSGFTTPGLISSSSVKVLYSSTINYPGFTWYPFAFGGGWTSASAADDGGDSRVNMAVQINVGGIGWRTAAQGTTTVGNRGLYPVEMSPDPSSTTLRITDTATLNIRVVAWRAAGDTAGVNVYNTAPWVTVLKMPIE